MSDPVFYKITNRYETHHDYPYKDDLNVLDDNLDDDDYEEDDTSFTNRHYLHHFYKQGVWLREITLPTDAKGFQVRKHTFLIDAEDRWGVDNTGTKWKANMVVFGERHPLYCIKTIKRFHLVITEDYVRCAIREGDLDLLEFLWEKHSRMFGEVDKMEVLIRAIKTRCLNKVKYLHQKFVSDDKNMRMSYGLVNVALLCGNYEVTKYLVKCGGRLRHNAIMDEWRVDDQTMHLLEKYYGDITVYDTQHAYDRAMEELTARKSVCDDLLEKVVTCLMTGVLWYAGSWCLDVLNL